MASFLYFRLFNTVDWIRFGPLESEATSLPTEPQPLPIQCFFSCSFRSSSLGPFVCLLAIRTPQCKFPTSQLVSGLWTSSSFSFILLFQNIFYRRYLRKNALKMFNMQSQKKYNLPVNIIFKSYSIRSFICLESQSMVVFVYLPSLPLEAFLSDCSYVLSILSCVYYYCTWVPMNVDQLLLLCPYIWLYMGISNYYLFALMLTGQIH